MSAIAVDTAPSEPLGVRLGALVAAAGSGAHPHAVRLAGPDASRRDLADAVHALCAIHGTQPGLADIVRSRAGEAFGEAAGFFGGERALLARLCAVAGPLPSTPHHAAAEGAMAAQRHALAVLAASDRPECAAGVVAALLLDWAAIRPVLARAADAFGLAGGIETELPSAGTLTASLVDASTGRAARFGAEQLLVQHRGLWSLLEARADARAA